MQTKRDLVQAYLFQVGRMRSALLKGEANLPETPLRRTSTGMFAGIMIAILLVVAAVLWGVFLPATTSDWRTDGALVANKESGARYLYLGGSLHPVLNTASAWLITGGPAKLESVSPESLEGTPRGDPVGVPGAPDEVPGPAQLTSGPWAVCSPSARAAPSVLVDPNGVDVADQDRGLLVATPDGSTYLVWRDRRLRIPSRSSRIALGYGGAGLVPVSAGWLDALTATADLIPPAVPGRGQPGPVLSGRATSVGQLIEVTAGDAVTPYLVMSDGLVPITRTTESLVIGDPASSAAYGGDPVAPARVDPVAVAAQPVSRQVTTRPGWPSRPPLLLNASQAGRVPCVQITPGQPGPGLRLSSMAGGGAGAEGPGEGRASMAPGRGVLVRSQSAPGIVNGTLYLLTDTGLKYPLASQDAAAALGYGDVVAVSMPAMVLGMVATGPTLDPKTAGRMPPAGG